jgi:hypothetical protein
MNNHGWFRRLGWFYFPVSVPGAVLCVLAFIFCVQVFVAVDRHSHSVSDTLYGIFPYFSCAFLLLNWVASNTSAPDPGPVVSVDHRETPRSVPGPKT